ncbi:MAG: hypothetical protein AAGF23_11245 [Acidobacteriota bacterium]
MGTLTSPRLTWAVKTWAAKTWAIKNRWAATIVAGLLLAGPAASPAAAKDDVSRIERWRAEIAEIDALQKSDGKRAVRKAAKEAKKLFKEVRQRGWREPALRPILAELATQVAISELNQGGDRDRAIWRFHSALLLDGAVSERDWGAYGRAGRVLAEIELRTLGTTLPGQRALTRPYPRGGRFEKPGEGPVKRIEVPLNRSARNERRIERPTLEVIIHRDGSVSHPAVKIGHSAKPTVLLAVLDMAWEMAPYLPAKLDGETVDVVYEVSVGTFNYDRWDEMVVYY